MLHKDPPAVEEDSGTPPPPVDSGTDPTTDTPPEERWCPRPAATYEQVRVSPDLDGAALAEAIAAAPQGSTVLFASGAYALGGATLHLDTPGVTLTAESGRAEDVLLDGQGRGGPLVAITASDVTLASLTLAWSGAELIDATPAGAPLTGLRLNALSLYDPVGVAIRFGTDGAGSFVDGAEIGCSSVELTVVGRAELNEADPAACPTGGLEAFGSADLHLHDTTFSGFWCATGTAAPAVHLGGGARTPLFERNLLLDNTRGIVLGDEAPADGARPPEAGDCPESGGPVTVYGGVLRNNAVTATDPTFAASEARFDLGLRLESVCDAEVLHTTVFGAFPTVTTDLDARGAGTRVLFQNNLSGKPIRSPPELAVTAVGNLVGTDEWLTSDLHLVSDAPAINAGEPLEAGACGDDRDGDARDALPDVGADER